MGQFAPLLRQHLGDAIIEHGRAHRDVARGDALGDRHDVGLESEIVRPNHSPVRPNPQITSSAISSTSWLAADALDFRPVGVGGM
jgi:hypothetical protein